MASVTSFPPLPSTPQFSFFSSSSSSLSSSLSYPFLISANEISVSSSYRLGDISNNRNRFKNSLISPLSVMPEPQGKLAGLLSTNSLTQFLILLKLKQRSSRTICSINSQRKIFLEIQLKWLSEFARRLRLLAESKGFRLDDTGSFPASHSSSDKRGTKGSASLKVDTEKEVFDFLGFPWLEPNERNL